MDSNKKRIKLTLKNISKSFYTRKEVFEAVNNISLDVYENEFLVILGPGQCGKSVLLNMISGLEMPTAGTVKFAEEKEAEVGFVFQKTAVFPTPPPPPPRNNRIKHKAGEGNFQCISQLPQLPAQTRKRSAVILAPMPGVFDSLTLVPRHINNFCC